MGPNQWYKVTSTFTQVLFFSNILRYLYFITSIICFLHHILEGNIYLNTISIASLLIE